MGGTDSCSLVGRVGRLPTDQCVGTEDQFPPALDRGIVRHAIIRPAEFVLTLFEPVFDPRAQAIGVADGLLDFADPAWS